MGKQKSGDETPALNRRGAMMQSVIRALSATSQLRLLLSQEGEPSDPQLNIAFTQLFWHCEPLIQERACLVPLALLRERIRIYLLERGVESISPRLNSRPIQRRTNLHLVLEALERLNAALSRVLEGRRESLLETSPCRPQSE